MSAVMKPCGGRGREVKGTGPRADRAAGIPFRGLALLCLAAVLAVAGCTTVPERRGAEGQVITDWRAPAIPSQWLLQARAAVDSERQSGTVNVRWRQQEDDYRVDLRAPLGAGAVRVLGNGAEVTVRTSDGEVYRGASAGEVLRRRTGYDLPIGNLAWWIRGVPAPGEHRVILDEEGRPRELRQSGWRVIYDRWERIGDYRLPVRLELHRSDIRVRMAVRRWEV